MSPTFSFAGKVSVLTEKASRVRRKSRRCSQELWYLIRTGFGWLWRGEVDEGEKVVLRKNRCLVLIRCWAHIVTLTATAVLANLNLNGRFVGTNLPGNPDPNYQAFYQLCFQFTAKVLVCFSPTASGTNSFANRWQELLIVASLATIFVDIVGIQLLSGASGLPLGLLTSKQSFTEVQYLLSPQFRCGLAGYPWRERWRVRIAFGLFIIASFVISILAGPSVALLVIPSLRTNFPGGGASLWLWGDEDSLWPSKLTIAHTGPSQCASPNVTTLDSEALDYTYCIWGGYSALSEFFKQSHGLIPGNFTYQDGILNRDVALHPNSADRVGGPAVPSFVYTAHLAVGIMLKNAGQLWYEALLYIPESSSYYTLRYRNREATTGYAQTWLPAVRTSCIISRSINESHSLDLLTVCYTHPATLLVLR